MSVALLFSPQGSQAVGMGRELAELEPAARAVFTAADAALDWSVSQLAWHGPPERLDETRWTQPALLTTSLAALAALRARATVTPQLVAGHSVGEYAALVAAGVISFPDALRLTELRGRLMAEAGADGGMTAVIGLDREAVAEVVASTWTPDELVVANDNAPGQIVISGTTDALAGVEASLRDAGARRLIPLPVSGPFHSPQMATVGGDLAAAFDEVEWHDAQVPVISNVTARPERDAATLRRLLAEQVHSPVEWVRSVGSMVEGGVDTAIECGPGAALVGMVRRIVPSMRTATVGDAAGLDEALALLAGVAQPAEASV